MPLGLFFLICIPLYGLPLDFLFLIVFLYIVYFQVFYSSLYSYIQFTSWFSIPPVYSIQYIQFTSRFSIPPVYSYIQFTSRFSIPPVYSTSFRQNSTKNSPIKKNIYKRIKGGSESFLILCAMNINKNYKFVIILKLTDKILQL